MKAFAALLVIALSAHGALASDTARVLPVNIIDGTDERGSLLELGPGLGLTRAEIDRIRMVFGHVGCFSPTPVAESGALFLTNDQVLAAGHTFFEADGTPRTECYFRLQTPGSEWRELLTDAKNARFGARPPRRSNDDWAVVRLAEPVTDAVPFPVDATKPAVGDQIVVVTAQPVDLRHLDPNVPVVQGCKVRRAPVSTAATSFYRTDCDATGGSSGGMHLVRVAGQLVFRGMTISTGPWRDPAFVGAPYDERGGNVTTALGTDAAILEAGRQLEIEGRFWSAAPAE